MNEITRVVLENEMDLILAHKQCMKLAELAGLSLAAQTTFATAVSEVSRNCIGTINQSCLVLFVSDKKEKIKFITAVLEDKRQNFSAEKDEGYNYAKRLVQNIAATTGSDGNKIELNFRLPATLRIDDPTLEKWRILMNTDPAVSPYEEIKRKNRQLVEMADKLRISEQQYRSLTDSLPLMIFTVNPGGEMIYANKWVQQYTGESIEQLNTTKWQQVMHPDDFSEGWENWDVRSATPEGLVIRERRFKQHETDEYRWHFGVSIAMHDDGGSVVCWNTYFVDIHAQKTIEQALKDNKELKETKAELEEKVDQLNRSNEQLEQFAYIASHDLQEPLRKIGFYSDFLNKKYGHLFPDEAGVFFNNMLKSTDRMKLLIQDVLSYSTVRQGDFASVDLNEIAAEIIEDLEFSINEKHALITVGKLPVIDGIQRQLKQLFENIVSNGLKFAKNNEQPRIAITADIEDNNVRISFADNGIGFEQKYISKMFDLFQQLHTRDKYKGTGIGLAICKKIVDIHNGNITATGTIGEGSVFFVTLPLSQQKNKQLKIS